VRGNIMVGGRGQIPWALLWLHPCISPKMSELEWCVVTATGKSQHRHCYNIA